TTLGSTSTSSRSPPARTPCPSRSGKPSAASRSSSPPGTRWVLWPADKELVAFACGKPPFRSKLGMVGQISRGLGPARSAAADEGHFRGCDRQELDVRVERQPGHEQDRVSDVPRIEGRLWGDRAVGLWRAAFQAAGHLGGGVANVDLAACDVEWASVQ